MQAQSSPTPAAQQKNAAILLIDDEEDILSIFKNSLKAAGYSTYGFINPIAAFEHFRQNSKAYQIIITDVRMPGMSGFELVRKIRRINPDVKIIMTSSFEMSMNEVKRVLPSLKIDGVVDKPVRLAKLNDMVKNLLESSKWMQKVGVSDGAPSSFTCLPHF
jgi:DNA-binding NtrC family response regulator